MSEVLTRLQPQLIVELYAIRRKPDGWMLPAGRKKGFTHDEPQDPSKRAPRLFTRVVYARSALREWLKGETTVRYCNDGWDGAGDDEKWETSPRPDRKAEDMEVVVVRLSVMGAA